ncbi:hypothetical protein FS749_005290 [Ceratobasidium sp. UAMH 11750]|nr:hypothetical protein FS749_005290 [Ceratobasidium sp. UAMH 11750]
MREDRIKKALEDLHKGVFTNVSKAAEAHNIPCRTLADRASGVHASASVGHAHRQTLSPAIESILVEWCIHCGGMGVPWTKEELLTRAQELAGPNHKVSSHWYKQFIKRHRLVLKFKRAYEVDPKRASGFNRATLLNHFAAYQAMIETYHIPPEHQWNMDEKGVQGGGGRSTSRQKHFFSLLEKSQYKLKSDDLELTMAIECASATGVAMKPSFVHQRGDVGKWWEDKRIGW